MLNGTPRATSGSLFLSQNIAGGRLSAYAQAAFHPTPQGVRSSDEGWLDLHRAASVEVTPEEKDYAIDSARVSGETQGWRAASPGTQTIELLFDNPQRLRAPRSFSRKLRQCVLKSLSCDGLQMAVNHFEKLFASSGILAHLIPFARSRNITLNFPMSRFLNWSSCLTSIEERLAPRSRVCACLDPP